MAKKSTDETWWDRNKEFILFFLFIIYSIILGIK